MRIKEELEKKLLEEFRLKEEAEKKRKKCEFEEEEVLKRLQTTTQLHKNLNEEIQKLNLRNVMNGEFNYVNNNFNNNNNNFNNNNNSENFNEENQ